MKQCSKCGVVKPYNEFYKQSRSNDGLQIYCKQCHNETNIKWQKDNPEKVKQIKKISDRKYRTKNSIGVYGLYNKLEQCYDYIGQGQLKNREIFHKSATGQSTPWQVKLNIWFDGWDNVYEFRVLCECKNKQQCEEMEVKYINELNPRYNRYKRQHEVI